MAAVRFLLNGEPRAEDNVSPTTTVLDWLRGRARLTGTKEGCAEGDCGACTIALRKPGVERFVAANSCLMLLPQLDGCEVLTVEGLAAPDGTLHPVQQALVEADATQCGFCTPGFAMAMFAFRDGGEPADDAHIHEALAGNLCRCTGYRSIVAACRKAATTTSLESLDRHPEARATDLGLARDRQYKLRTSTTADLRGEPRRASARAVHPSRLAALAPQDDGNKHLRKYVYGSQSFLAPCTLANLIDLRAAHPDAILLAGGTDLGLRVSKDRETFPRVISTGSVAELRQVLAQDEALEIGGAATYTDALPFIDEHFLAFGALIRRIGSRQIRNLGTFAGNLATASPIGDTLPCLIALEAEVMLRSRRSARTVKVEDFIVGYRKTALAPDEIITAIRIPYLHAEEQFAAYKLSKRFDQDISTVVAAFRLARNGGGISKLHAAFGGMAAQPTRAFTLENVLAGRPWTQTALADVDALLAQDFAPLSDHRGSGGYRLRAAAGLVRRFQLETTAPKSPTRVEEL